MENEKTPDEKRNEVVFSKKFRAGRRRTYFFDVKTTKANDFYLTLTESKKRHDGMGYERHKVFLYKEDFNRFMEALNETINHIKTNLMPEYDFDEFARRDEEYRQKQNESGNEPSGDSSAEDNPPAAPRPPEDDDMKW